MAEIDANKLAVAIAEVADVGPEPGLFGATELVLAAAEAHLAHLRAPKGELEALADSLKYPEQAELWDAINDYAEACGARTSKHTAAVESIVRAALSRARGEGT